MLAAGLVEDSEAGRLMAHAATCAWCGAILGEAAAPPTEEELAFAAASRLGNAGNRRAFAARMATVSGHRPKPARLRWWWGAIPVPAALVAAGIFFGPSIAVLETERQLARAYTEYRPTEIRLPGAAYGPVQRNREAFASLPIRRSPDLLEAEARILRQVEAHPDDPNWLHLEGRDAFLTGDANQAIEELDRARTLRPNDAYILSDLGSAWFLKARRPSGQAPDLASYSKAYDFLAQAARLKPKDPALAFNKALAAERIYAYTTAQEAWTAYLALDSTSPWAKEAREHLEEVKKNLSGSGHTPPPPPLKL